MKGFFKHLLDVLFPLAKKNNCPYCGGGKCFGLCSLSDGQTEPQKKDVAHIEAEAKRLYDERSVSMTTAKVLTCLGGIFWAVAFILGMLGITTPMTVGIPDGIAILGFLLIMFLYLAGFVLILLGVLLFFIQKRKMNRVLRKG